MSLKSSPLPDDTLQDILVKSFTSSFRSGYVEVEGCMMPEYFMHFAQRIRDLSVREDDVLVCSYPKCGTTWAQEMVWCIANDLDLEKAKELPLQERFPFLEHSGLFDYRDLMKSRPEIQFPEYVLDSVGYASSLEGPRFLKTHLPLQLLPRQMLSEQRPAKIIYVSRDPRDCCISYYHHSKLLEGFTGDFQNFLKLFLAGRVNYGDFWEHVLGYWKIRNQPNVLFITYQDMKKDLSSVIRAVSKFLNKSYCVEQVERLCEHLGFESMRRNKSVNYEAVMEINKKYGLIQEEGVFMRAGKTGEFLEAMSENEIELVNEWCRLYLKNSDYELPKYDIKIIQGSY